MSSLNNVGIRVLAWNESWTEYVDTLEDSLLESNEFVASITSAQDTIVNELKDEHMQMKVTIAQNEKLMTMLKANLSGKWEEAGS